jgi:hypothetical protein
LDLLLAKGRCGHLLVLGRRVEVDAATRESVGNEGITGNSDAEAELAVVVAERSSVDENLPLRPRLKLTLS